MRGFVCSVIIFALFGVFSACHAQADLQQDSLKAICTKWIASTDLVKILNVDSIDLSKHENRLISGPSSLTATVYFRFADHYPEPAATWYYIKQHFHAHGTDIEKLLRYKIRDLIGANAVDSVRLHIPFDDIKPKGIVHAAGFKFKEVLDGSFTDSYPVDRKITNLTVYVPTLAAYFKEFKHKAGKPILVRPIEEDPEELKFNISNAFGEITGRYYEQIKVAIRLKQHLGFSEVFFAIEDVKYGAGLLGAPKDEKNYADAGQDFFVGEWECFEEIKTRLKQIIK